MVFDISNFYLNIPLKRKKYLHRDIADFQAGIDKHYNLKEKGAPDGNICICAVIRKGCRIAQELLIKCLDNHGHCQSTFTPGLWMHCWCPVYLSLLSKLGDVKCMWCSYLIGTTKVKTLKHFKFQVLPPHPHHSCFGAKQQFSNMSMRGLIWEMMRKIHPVSAGHISALCLCGQPHHTTGGT